MTTPLAAARKLHADGFAVIPVPYGSKNPNRKKWQKERWTAEQLPDQFNGKAQNIGVLCGAPSGGRTDADLDCDEAVIAGGIILPPTRRIGGRTSRPRSHWWHIVDEPPAKATTQFIDPVRKACGESDDRAMLLEWRSTNGQTVVYGRHPTDEEYRWDEEGEPARVSARELNRRIRHTAVAALLGRYWPAKGARHPTAMAAAGLLLNCNVPGDDATTIIKAAATIAGDEEVADRVTAVKTTIKRKEDGEQYTGGTNLAKLLGEHGGLIVSQIQEWLLPRPVFRTTAKDGDGGDDDGADSTAAAQPARYQLTDLGNAERMIARYGHDLRYVPTWGWMVFDQRRWVRDEEGIRVARLAAATVRAMYEEAAADEDVQYRAILAKHAVASERAARIAAIVTLARSLDGVVEDASAFDAQPHRLTCLNGTLDLETGQLTPHRREDLITKLVPVAYDPDAAAPQWEAFLRRIFADDAEVIDYVQRAAGYALTGDTGERALFVLHGKGANGKSTLLELLRAVLGDYALRTPAETLLAKREGGIPNDVARIRGARLVTASETEDGRRFAEAFIKDLTGGDTLSARFMRAEWFDFKPVCKVWLATNHKPEVRGTDNAIWDRIRLIPFNVSIPKGERDTRLAARLSEELPGILAWAVEGCWSWLNGGLREPAVVCSATDQYRVDQDVLGTFIEDRCHTHQNAKAYAGELYRTYAAWCESAGEKPLTQRTFGMRLTERGFQQRRGAGGVRLWEGIGLVVTDKEPDASDASDG